MNERCADGGHFRVGEGVRAVGSDPRMKSGWTARGWKVASGLGRVSVRRGVGFGGFSSPTGNYFTTAFIFFSGMAEINARKALFTSSDVVKTFATSGSTMTINGSFFIRDAKRFGFAFL